jgi:hypothetical protein
VIGPQRKRVLRFLYWLSIVACLFIRCLVTLFTIGLKIINSLPIVAGTDRIENTAALYCCRFQATTLKRTTKKTRHVVFIVVLPRRYQATSTPQAFTISIYYFIIPYILDDYNRAWEEQCLLGCDTVQSDRTFLSHHRENLRSNLKELVLRARLTSGDNLFSFAVSSEIT